MHSNVRGLQYIPYGKYMGMTDEGGIHILPEFHTLAVDEYGMPFDLGWRPIALPKPGEFKLSPIALKIREEERKKHEPASN